jgi:hypothetical protein
MTVPGFTAEAALALKAGQYRESQTSSFAATVRGTVLPQSVYWCSPCRNGVKVCCTPWQCFVEQCVHE